MQGKIINNDVAQYEYYDSLSITDATRLQKELRAALIDTPVKRPIKTIAGADISLNRFSDVIYAGIIILDYKTLQPISYSLVKSKTTFPYIPGFLAFREVPALLTALSLIPVKPNIIMVDGHGIAHPRRMGIGAHLGALASIPTIGCAKKKLFGHYKEPALDKGAYEQISYQDEILGYALRTKNNVKPVFVSPGNLADLADCLSITTHCVGKYRLPEPTRKAHEFVNLFRTGNLEAGFHEIKKENTLF